MLAPAVVELNRTEPSRTWVAAARLNGKLPAVGLEVVVRLSVCEPVALTLRTPSTRTRTLSPPLIVPWSSPVTVMVGCAALAPNVTVGQSLP